MLGASNARAPAARAISARRSTSARLGDAKATRVSPEVCCGAPTTQKNGSAPVSSDACPHQQVVGAAHRRSKSQFDVVEDEGHSPVEFSHDGGPLQTR